MKTIRKPRIVLLLTCQTIVLSGLVLFLCGCSDHSNGIRISINQFVFHPNLEATYKGFKDVVDQWALKKRMTVEYRLQNANGDISLAMQIARQQAAEKPSLILALATPSAQATQKATGNIPIIFGAITDPVAAGLVKSYENPGGNISGSSDQWPYQEQFELIKQLRPRAKTVGILLNPGESNTISSLKLIDAALEKTGLAKIEAPVTNTAEIYQAASSLVGRCDVFYAPADNTVLSGLDAFVKVAEISKIPLFVGDEGSISKGGCATYGMDYYELGKATGEIAIKVLEGVPVGTIPVATGKGSRLIINLDAAKRQGLEIPQELVKGAKLVR